MHIPNPSDRPVKRRHGARVLVVADDSVLLVRDTDPGVPGSRWWVLPGGGLDEGEHAREGAARELAEETGLTDAVLVGPIAERVVTHGYSDRVLIQHELFYRADVQRFDPAPTGLSTSEMQREVTCEWAPVTDLGDRLVWPVAIADLLTATTDAPLAWGEVEESTVAVAPDQ